MRCPFELLQRHSLQGCAVGCSKHKQFALTQSISTFLCLLYVMVPQVSLIADVCCNSAFDL